MPKLQKQIDQKKEEEACGIYNKYNKLKDMSKFWQRVDPEFSERKSMLIFDFFLSNSFPRMINILFHLHNINPLSRKKVMKTKTITT